MFNEEVEQYTDEDMVGNEQSMLSYEEDEEFQKIRKEHVFADLDFSKRKTKIVCTLGQVIL